MAYPSELIHRDLEHVTGLEAEAEVQPRLDWCDLATQGFVFLSLFKIVGEMGGRGRIYQRLSKSGSSRSQQHHRENLTHSRPLRAALYAQPPYKFPKQPLAGDWNWYANKGLRRSSSSPGK